MRLRITTVLNIHSFPFSSGLSHALQLISCVAFTAKDVGLAGTPQPGTVRGPYLAGHLVCTRLWHMSFSRGVVLQHTSGGQRGTRTYCIYLLPHIKHSLSTDQIFIPSLFCSSVSCSREALILFATLKPPAIYTSQQYGAPLCSVCIFHSRYSLVQVQYVKTGTCCLLAGPTSIAKTGLAPEVPKPSKICCLHESFDLVLKLWFFSVQAAKP